MSTEHFQSEAAAAVPETGTTAVPDAVDNGTQGEEETTPRTFTQEEFNAGVGEAKAKLERKIRREMAQAAEQPRQIQTVAPQPAQFANQEAYNTALINHRAEELANHREEQKKQNDTLSAYREREDQARDKYPDYDQLFHLDLPISPVMAGAIMESDIGPEVAYFLGSNPKEVARIFALSPASQAREIGKIEANLTTNPPVKKTSSAPNPISPVGSRSTSQSYDTTDPRSIASSDTSDWIAKENKRRMKLLQG